MKRILVTGASGFVGSHVLAQLLEQGYEVHAVDMRQWHDAPPAVLWHHADLLNHLQTADLIKEVRPTHLLHFAWYSEPKLYWNSTENFRWLESSISLLRSFHLHGGRRLVMAGTCAEYDWDYGFCSELITPCNPVTPYGACKNILQETLRAYSEEVHLSSAWGRIFFMYGPGENTSRLVASVVTSALRGELVPCSHGAQLRDFLHVEDVASAFIALLESDVSGPVNIASGHPVAIRDLVLAAADLVGAKERIQFGALATPKNDPPLLVGDSRRLNMEVGWHPRYDLLAGIEKTVHWWKSKLGVS
jgi:nucleoside-diphosphate-sugar epimerase